MNLIYQTLILFVLSYSITLYLIIVFVHKIQIKDQSPWDPRITCLILEFENFQNDLLGTVENVCENIPRVIIYSETFIYPPINFSRIKNCQIDLIELDKFGSHQKKDLFGILQNEDYLFILPDSTRIKELTSILSRIKQTNADALLIPINSMSKELKCDYFHFDLKRWTLSFNETWSKSCFYKNSFAVFIKKNSLLRISFPLLRPFLQSFQIQSQIFNLKIELFNKSLLSSHLELYNNDHHKQKYEYLKNHRTYLMYTKLGIKKVSNYDAQVEWFGCDRQQPRCFGSIIENIPDYMVKGRWLPPCCRRNLETTARYVFSLLEKFKIRYWLEGGSLLGAARNGQIIDWDYDVDIGIYQEDMQKLPSIQKLFLEKPGYHFEDGQGFVWERALEGEFIKIHFSKINRIHVDIFPFVSINGTMTKNTWFLDHPQDMPFSEHYLKPLERIQFIGMNVSVPNNIRSFLEMKFGQNCIEQPKYPSDKIELEFI